jgi:hypothetical protein
MLKSAGWWAVRRTGLNKFFASVIDTKLGVWVVYIKMQLGITTQVFVIKVNVTVTINRNSVSAQ